MTASSWTYTAEQMALRPLLAHANINPDSFLATDYLNHFNEIVMTLEMAIDMPELMEDARDWKPVSYVQHFEQSNFAEKDLVIEAYSLVPAAARQSFEDVVACLEEFVVESISLLSAAFQSETGLNESQVLEFEERRKITHDMLGQLNGMINSRNELDETPVVEQGDAHSQDEIDQLFD